MPVIFFTAAIIIVIAAFVVLLGCGPAMGIYALVGFILGTIIGGTRGEVLHDPFGEDTWNEWSWKWASIGAVVGSAVLIGGQMLPIKTLPLNYGKFKLDYELADIRLGSIQIGIYSQALQSAYDKKVSFTFGYYK